MGVVSYKAQGVELLLDPNHVAPTKGKAPKALRGDLQHQIDSVSPRMSDEDWLLAGVQPDELGTN